MRIRRSSRTVNHGAKRRPAWTTMLTMNAATPRERSSGGELPDRSTDRSGLGARRGANTAYVKIPLKRGFGVETLDGIAPPGDSEKGGQLRQFRTARSRARRDKQTFVQLRVSMFHLDASRFLRGLGSAPS